MPSPSDPHTIWEQDNRHHRRCPREDYQHLQDGLDRLYGHCPAGEWDEGLARWLVAHDECGLGRAT